MSGLRGTDPLRAWTKTAGWGLSLRRRCGAAGVVILFGATVSGVAVMQCGGCMCLACEGQTLCGVGQRRLVGVCPCVGGVVRLGW